MGTAEALTESTIPITELLTWAEIQVRFPYQYVLLVDVGEDLSGGMAAVRGRVMCHGKSPKDLVARSASWRRPDQLVGYFYTGVGMPDEDEDRDVVRVHQ